MNKKQVKQYLVVGLIGTIITIIGEMSEGFVISPDTTDQMTKLFSSIELLPIWRIGFGSTVGSLGILIQFFGFYGIYLSFKNKKAGIAKLYTIGNWGFTIIGAMIHIILSVFMYVYKINVGTAGFNDMMREFTIWFIVPLLIIFLIGYMMFSVAMFLQILKGNTIFPKWCLILNPVIGKIVINIITAIMPNSAITNGIGFSDMGITSLIIFVVLLANMKDKETE